MKITADIQSASGEVLVAGVDVTLFDDGSGSFHANGADRLKFNIGPEHSYRIATPDGRSGVILLSGMQPYTGTHADLITFQISGRIE